MCSVFQTVKKEEEGDGQIPIKLFHHMGDLSMGDLSMGDLGVGFGLSPNSHGHTSLLIEI